IAQESASAPIPDRRRPMPPSGQRSQTSDSWSMAASAAPARAIVAGSVVGTPGPGLASKTPRRSARSTTAWPAMVSTTEAAATRRVSIRPVPGVVSLEPGQSFHQNATHGDDGQRERRQRAEDQQRCLGAAGAQGEGEEDDRAEQQPALTEPGLRREAPALQIGERQADAGQDELRPGVVRPGPVRRLRTGSTRWRTAG